MTLKKTSNFRTRSWPFFKYGSALTNQLILFEYQFIKILKFKCLRQGNKKLKSVRAWFSIISRKVTGIRLTITVNKLIGKHQILSIFFGRHLLNIKMVTQLQPLMIFYPFNKKNKLPMPVLLL